MPRAPSTAGAVSARFRRSRSRQEAVSQQRPQHDEAVSPRDFLTLGELASGVRDGHLVNTNTHLENAGSNFGIEPPTGLAQVELTRNVNGEDLVTGLHVRERGIEQDVAQQREQLIA